MTRRDLESNDVDTAARLARDEQEGLDDDRPAASELAGDDRSPEPVVFVDGHGNVPGCACDDRCEFPCWQRVGLTGRSCCRTPAAERFLDRHAGP